MAHSREATRSTQAYAPGRVNLIGDHTDYEGGHVLPCAIDLGTTVTITVDPTLDVPVNYELPNLDIRGDDAQRVVSAAIIGAAREAVFARLPRSPAPETRFRVRVNSTLPIGAGLSSSTALAAASVQAFATQCGLKLTALQLRRTISAVEHSATGVHVGTMDQRIIVGAHRGHASLIDCRSGRTRYIRVPDDLAIVVVFSGDDRHLATSNYTRNRNALNRFKKRLGVETLRGVAPERVKSFPLARHVVSEQHRTLAAARALSRGDLERFGILMDESHASLRDDFGVSTPALEALTTAFRDAGAFGARLTGAGEGGCVVAAVPSQTSSTIAALAVRSATRHLGRELAWWTVHAVDGVARSTPQDR